MQRSSLLIVSLTIIYLWMLTWVCSGPGYLLVIERNVHFCTASAAPNSLCSRRALSDDCHQHLLPSHRREMAEAHLATKTLRICNKQIWSHSRWTETSRKTGASEENVHVKEEQRTATDLAPAEALKRFKPDPCHSEVRGQPTPRLAAPPEPGM